MNELHYLENQLSVVHIRWVDSAKLLRYRSASKVRAFKQREGGWFMFPCFPLQLNSSPPLIFDSQHNIQRFPCSLKGNYQHVLLFLQTPEGRESHFSLIVLLLLHWSIKIISERVLSHMPNLSTLSAQELKPGLRSVYTHSQQQL